MASPAQVANDMEAQSRFWEKRDRKIASACADAARVIRAYLAGERVDGRTYGGLHRRLLELATSRRFTTGRVAPNFERALGTLHGLKSGAQT